LYVDRTLGSLLDEHADPYLELVCCPEHVESDRLNESTFAGSDSTKTVMTYSPAVEWSLSLMHTLSQLWRQ